MTLSDVHGYIDRGLFPFAECPNDDLMPVHSAVLADGVISFSCPECKAVFPADFLLWMSRDEASEEGWVIRLHTGLEPMASAYLA